MCNRQCVLSFRTSSDSLLIILASDQKEKEAWRVSVEWSPDESCVGVWQTDMLQIHLQERSDDEEEAFLLFQCRQEDVVLNKTLLYVVSLVCYLLWAVSLSPLPHRLDVDGDLSFFFLLSSLSSLSSLLQPEDGMVRMQSPLKLQIRAAATLLIALPCFKMSVCESVNKPLLAGREHNCTSRASLCKTAPKCKQAHKAARRFVTVRGWWLWFELKGISWLELRFKAAYVSPFLCQDRSPTDFCCRVLFFFFHPGFYRVFGTAAAPGPILSKAVTRCDKELHVRN